MSSSSEAGRRKLAHKKFWRSDSRTKLIPAARLVRVKLDLSLNEIEQLVQARAGPEFHASHKSIGRWLDNKIPQSFAPMTALCLVLWDLVNEQRTEFQNPEELDAFQILQTLAARIGSDAALELTSPVRVGDGGKYDPRHLRKIIDGIAVPGEIDDPDEPEFPPNSPRFPATPQVPIPDRAAPLLIKDESWNSTGSHKDRWAWEKLLSYRDALKRRLDTHGASKTLIDVPRLSMISAGSAAFALQSLLRLYGLPPLRVLVDEHRTSDATIGKLEAIGAVVKRFDLDSALLSEHDVRLHTDNLDGYDLTTRDLLAPQRERFFDWLTCEILLLAPTYIFVPFGTGELYINIILFLEEQASARVSDRRLIEVDTEKLKGIHVIGATAASPNTQMDKLYARHRPLERDLAAKLDELKRNGVLGQRSQVIAIKDAVARMGKKLADQYRINTELSGIAGLGLFLELEQRLELSKEDVVVVVNTGWLRDDV